MRLYADLSWLKWCFSVPIFHIWALTWLNMQFSAILVLYPAIRVWLWVKNHNFLGSRVQNIALTLISIAYQSFLFAYIYKFVNYTEISPVCRFAILMEQFVNYTEISPVCRFAILMEQDSNTVCEKPVRMSMKSHSFIEENRYRNVEVSKDKTRRDAPTISQFMYFLIAPTLLYRDNYVRTNKVRWKLVVWYFLQVLFIMFCMFAISWRFVEHNFKWTGVKPFTIR
ncbi:unnamed protein product, partial [Medioppia subpectinata]